MMVEKHKIADRDFWFTIERPFIPDSETGELVEASGHYVAFSTREPSALIAGEIVKDARGRAQLFASEGNALAAGIIEVHARLSVSDRTYAVGLPRDTQDAEYQEYVRMLNQQGIDFKKSRVEDSYGRKWLHVWPNRSDAEKFAMQIRKATRNPDWEVYELGLPATDAMAEEADPIIILVGQRGDGNTYELHPNSLKLIGKQFPTVPRSPSAFIARETHTHYQENVGRPLYDNVMTILTGLEVANVVDTFGGYQVVDPISNLVLWQVANQS